MTPDQLASWNEGVIKCCCQSWQCSPEAALARLEKGVPGRKLKIDDGVTDYDIRDIRFDQLDIEVNSATFGDAT